MKLYSVNEFRASSKWPYAISAGSVVYKKTAVNEIEVLLLKRDPGNAFNQLPATSYHLPKGHVNFNEALEHAAVRETQEEAAVDVVLTGYLGVLQRDYIHPVHKTRTNKTVHFFAAEWVKDLAQQDDEHDGKTWVSTSEAIKLLGAPNPKGEDEIIQRLQQYLKQLEV